MAAARMAAAALMSGLAVGFMAMPGAQAQVQNLPQNQIQNDQAPELPLDHDARVNGIGAACTGVGSDSRADPRWKDYSLKLEFAGAHGEYLGYVDVTLNQDGHQLARVRCPGPWLLFQLPPGHYALEAWVGQQPARFDATVPARGQGRVVVHFPD